MIRHAETTPMPELEDIKLTPKGSLIIEMLAARYREGETRWNINRLDVKAAEKLLALGLVNLETGGPTADSLFIGLSARGIDYAISDTYLSPKERARTSLIRKEWGTIDLDVLDSKGTPAVDEQTARSLAAAFNRGQATPIVGVQVRNVGPWQDA